jgi:hypothetical protein
MSEDGSDEASSQTLGDERCGDAPIMDNDELFRLHNSWELFPHQKVAVREIISRRRVILAFDMGLGKTLIALVAARAFQQSARKLQDGWKRCKDGGITVLVLCPVSMIDAWQQQAVSVGVTITVHTWGKIPRPVPGSRCDDCAFYTSIP